MKNLEKKLTLSGGSYLILDENKKLHSETSPAVYVKHKNQFYFYINGNNIPFSIWINEHCKLTPIEKTELILQYG